jgi:hypothetical protein
MDKENRVCKRLKTSSDRRDVLIVRARRIVVHVPVLRIMRIELIWSTRVD